MEYDSGEFICPNCKNKRMSIYTNWILNKTYFDKYEIKVLILYYKSKSKSYLKCKCECIKFPFEIVFCCLYNNSYHWIFRLLFLIIAGFPLIYAYISLYPLLLLLINLCNSFIQLFLYICKKIDLCMKNDYTCLYFDYEEYSFKEKVLNELKDENFIWKDLFGTKEQDLIEYGKEYFTCNYCNWKEGTFLNFIPQSTRDNLDKKYITNKNNEINNIRSESVLLTSNISILFTKPDQSFNYFLSCNLNDKFTSIENLLYQNFPNLRKKKKINYFLCNGIRIIGKTRTLRNLNIENANIIVICYEELDPIISIIFEKNQEQKSIACNINDSFFFVEKKLYQKFPQIENENNYFVCNGNPITQKEKTLEELNIKNSDKTLIYETEKSLEEINIKNKKEINSSFVLNVESELTIYIRFKKEYLMKSVACNINDSFESIEKKLYRKFGYFKNEKNIFIYNGNEITEKKKTLRELNIKNSDIIEIFENLNISDLNIAAKNKGLEQYISIIFTTKDLSFNFSLACNVNEKFEDIEKKFYKNSIFKFENKELINFIHNNHEIIDKKKTLAELKFENSDQVIVYENPNISIIFSKQDQSFNYSISCNLNEKFDNIVNRFYQKSGFENKEVHFFHNGNEITDKTKTLDELKFKNSDKVIIFEYEKNE